MYMRLGKDEASILHSFLMIPHSPHPTRKVARSELTLSLVAVYTRRNQAGSMMRNCCTLYWVDAIHIAAGTLTALGRMVPHMHTPSL